MIDEARLRKYPAVRLDTLPSLREALGLYEALGFNDIPAYVYNPFEVARYRN
jgi:ribosomal protein S18 acetylase RimI-like enzyme